MAIDRRPSKRKKLSHGPQPSPPDQQLTASLTRISRVAKKVKTFEIQHLIRKIRLAKEGKPIRKNESLVVDYKVLEADLIKFKAIDPEDLSKKFLYTRLKKKSSDWIDHAIFEEFRHRTESICLDKIENKICSNKLLADVITQSVSKLLLQLKPQSADISDPKIDSAKPGPAQKTLRRSIDDRKTNVRSSEINEDLSGDELDEAVARELEALENADQSYTSDEESSQISDYHRIPDEPISGHESEESSTDHSSTDHPVSLTSEPREQKSEPTKSSKNLDQSTVARPSISSSVKDLSKHNSSRSSVSTFLPALNVGYTVGDSDCSSNSDIDDRALDKMERERNRKNRRGQRARRAIWEQKYGKSAKHLVKLKQQKHQRQDPGYARAHGNVMVPNRSEGGGKGYGSSKQKSDDYHKFKLKDDKPRVENNKAQGFHSSGLEDRPIVKKSDSQPVHPSWLAKQNQLKNLSLVKPAGKKIVFD